VSRPCWGALPLPLLPVSRIGIVYVFSMAVPSAVRREVAMLCLMRAARRRVMFSFCVLIFSFAPR
jgi:hypothetical protein